MRREIIKNVKGVEGRENQELKWSKTLREENNGTRVNLPVIFLSLGLPTLLLNTVPNIIRK